jgi:hypothetical protein
VPRHLTRNGQDFIFGRISDGRTWASLTAKVPKGNFTAGTLAVGCKGEMIGTMLSDGTHVWLDDCDPNLLDDITRARS